MPKDHNRPKSEPKPRRPARKKKVLEQRRRDQEQLKEKLIAARAAGVNVEHFSFRGDGMVICPRTGATLEPADVRVPRVPQTV